MVASPPVRESKADLIERMGLGPLDAALADIVATAIAGAQPSVLYHYTSPDAACDILRSREIWATHWQDTPDDKELRIGDGAFRSVTAGLLFHPQPCCTQAGYDAQRRYFNGESITDIGEVFIACFTALRGSRAHYDEFGAVGLGFRRLDDEQRLTPTWRGVAAGDVRYGIDPTTEMMREGANRVTAELMAFVDQHPERLPNAAHLAEVALLRIGAFVNVMGKREDKKREAEWRLGVIQWSDPGTVKTRVGRNGRRQRYVALELRNGRQRPVLEEIVIDPKSSDPAAVTAAVRACLDSEGYPPVPVVVGPVSARTMGPTSSGSSAAAL